MGSQWLDSGNSDRVRPAAAVPAGKGGRQRGFVTRALPAGTCEVRLKAVVAAAEAGGSAFGPTVQGRQPRPRRV